MKNLQDFGVELYSRMMLERHRGAKCTVYGSPIVGDPIDCVPCWAEARQETLREGWRRRRDEHTLTSDIPFTEPKP